MILGACRGDFRLTFVEAGLMSDPEFVLERQGENTRHPDKIRFTDTAGPGAMAGTIRACLARAMAHVEAGRRVPRDDSMPDLPEELIAALDADPHMAEAFRSLTPGRQKSHVLNLAGAKQSATRVARIAKFRDKILAGKGATGR